MTQKKIFKSQIYKIQRDKNQSGQLYYQYLTKILIIFFHQPTMGGMSAGAMNTSGFTHSIQNNQLPSYHHITHAGTYNEHFFQVGQKTQDLLDLHFGVGVSNCDLYGLPKRNFFLSLFLKSVKDGLPRTRNINASIVLDISGSMNSPIQYGVPSEKTRLMLARDAIFMFFEKLREDDIFSLVVFHNQARTVIESNFVSKMNKEQVKKAIYDPFESGGTTIRAGFNEAIKQINKHRADVSNYEHRIVMLTDVCDNSVSNEQKLIADISQSTMVNTTIIGISGEFQSSTCESLKEVKGFNYFCAVKNADLQTYLADRFDYTFFPCAEKITISLISDQIQSIKVYGSPDEDKTYSQKQNTFIITKSQSSFPSELIENKVKKDEIESLGGLILVKFVPKDQSSLPEIDLKLELSYRDLEGKQFSKQYVIKQKVSAEEYYSDSAARKGVSLFYYAQSMRNMLKTMNENFSDANKKQYIDNLNMLNDYCPQSKKDELAKVIEVVQKKVI